MKLDPESVILCEGILPVDGDKNIVPAAEELIPVSAFACAADD